MGGHSGGSLGDEGLGRIAEKRCGGYFGDFSGRQVKTRLLNLRIQLQPQAVLQREPGAGPTDLDAAQTASGPAKGMGNVQRSDYGKSVIASRQEKEESRIAGIDWGNPRTRAAF
jgi:hypothetical protein